MLVENFLNNLPDKNPNNLELKSTPESVFTKQDHEAIDKIFKGAQNELSLSKKYEFIKLRVNNDTSLKLQNLKKDLDISKKLKQSENIDDFSKKLDKLFPGKDFLSKMFKMLFSFAYGFSNMNNFESKNLEKQSKSLKSLTGYIADNKEKFGTKISDSDLKNKLKPESLKDFFKYLDGKNIDYSDDKFWERLFQREDLTVVDKLYNLNKKIVKNGKVLESNEGIDKLISKLNSLGKSKNTNNTNENISKKNNQKQNIKK